MVVSYVVEESSSLTIPDIVICPFNRLNRSYLAAHNLTNEMIRYIQLSFGTSNLYDYQFRTDWASQLKNETQQKLNLFLRNTKMDFKKFIDLASVACNAVIQYCLHPQLGRYDCCATSLVQMTSLGKCYRILGTSQIAAGQAYGLKLMVSLPYEVYTPAANSLHNDGIAVKLVERGRGIDYDLKFISAGVHAVMPLHAVKYDFMNDPPRFERYLCHTVVFLL